MQNIHLTHNTHTVSSPQNRNNYLEIDVSERKCLPTLPDGLKPFGIFGSLFYLYFFCVFQSTNTNWNRIIFITGIAIVELQVVHNKNKMKKIDNYMVYKLKSVCISILPASF